MGGVSGGHCLVPVRVFRIVVEAGNQFAEKKAARQGKKQKECHTRTRCEPTSPNRAAAPSKGCVVVPASQVFRPRMKISPGDWEEGQGGYTINAIRQPPSGELS